jgi:Zn-dependent protease/predicted transcriptional regulator
MKGSLNLANIFGIRVSIHWTFSLLIAYIVFSNWRAGHSPEQILWAVFFTLCIFATVFLHELGHAFAAKRFNIQVKSITLLPIGGLASLESMPEKPMEEFIIAIAGPLVNLAIAMLTALFIDTNSLTNLASTVQQGIDASNFLTYFFLINIWLVLFNLIPAFPMDGGRVLRALLGFKFKHHVATKIAARIGQFIALIFIFIGFSSNPFLIVIGVFILFSAQSEASYTETKSLLDGYTTRDAVMRHIATIEADQTLNAAVTMLLNGQASIFLVQDKGVAIASLTRDDIIRGLAEYGRDADISNVMNPNLKKIESSESLEKIYELLSQKQYPLIVVEENGHFIGAIDLENVLEFIMVVSNLKPN